MTDIVGVRATARQFPVGVSASEDRRSLAAECFTYYRATLGSPHLSANARLIGQLFLQLEGRGGWDRGYLAITEEEIAKAVSMKHETASRARKQLVKSGWCKAQQYRPRTVLPTGEMTFNGTNVYRLDFDKILALGPEQAPPARPATTVLRTEFVQVQQQLAAMRAALSESNQGERATFEAEVQRRVDLLIQERLDAEVTKRVGAEVTKRVEALVPQFVEVAMASVRSPAPPSVIPTSSGPGAGGSASGEVPGRPVRHTIPEERRLRSTTLTSVPCVGIPLSPSDGSFEIPSLSSQGSPEERERKTHTARAREPEAPTPGVCVVLDSRPYEILRHWAKRLTDGDPWEGVSVVTPGRLALMRRFLTARPAVSAQDACDAIDGAWLKPESFKTAKQLGIIFGDHFDAFCVEGRKARKLADEREKQRNRELEIEELEGEKGAELVPIPLEEFAKVRALAGVR